MTYEPTADELVHLNRCAELAEEALEAADEPFGTVLVSASGEVLFEDRNRTADGDQTRHPEFEVARWAARNMAPEDRADAVVFTSGEHCPMCSAAHGWVGLGRIVYIHSSAQVSAWRSELGVPAGPVNAIPIQEVVPGIRVDGPVAALEARMRELHTRACS
ncbi:nucleoside deaminase [Actinomadura sp. B10D3]|uniref:nucleoside deaminase n=1 Tax=Actinomadura sp. B10D3 TaxID=3153557 RepID=UPI00325CCFF0